MMVKKIPEGDLDIMDIISQEQAVAALVTSQAHHWREVGFSLGKESAERNLKFETWAAVIIALVMGFLMGSYPL